MTQLAVETAGATSLDLLAALHAASFSEPWDRDSLARLLALPGAFALIASAAGGPQAGPVGLALCRVAGDDGELLSLGVVPEVRRSGAARRLLSECAKRAWAMGGARMFLEVAQDNTAARRLYRSFGFVEVGRRPKYYPRSGGEAAAALTLRLNLAAFVKELSSCET